MSAVSNYITTNNLPAVVWLSADSSNINIIGNTFTWTNSLGDVTKNFSQVNLSNHPSTSSNGISFNINSSLSCNSALLTNVNNYTIIALTKDYLTQSQLLIKLADSSSYTKYSLEQGKINQEYKPYFTSDIVTNNTSTSNEVSELVIKRRIKYGDTFLQIKDTESTHRNFINSWRFDSSSSIIGQGLLNNLYHFLCFSDVIDNIHISNLIDLLIYSTPVLNPNPYWDLLLDVTWDNLTTPLWDNIL
jgi:hypothetical protein